MVRRVERGGEAGWSHIYSPLIRLHFFQLIGENPDKGQQQLSNGCTSDASSGRVKGPEAVGNLGEAPEQFRGQRKRRKDPSGCWSRIGVAPSCGRVD